MVVIIEQQLCCYSCRILFVENVPMIPRYAVVAHKSSGERNVLKCFDDFDRAEDYYFMCVESAEREDLVEYIIEWGVK